MTDSYVTYRTALRGEIVTSPFATASEAEQFAAFLRRMLITVLYVDLY